jgi:hypothetical protein
MSADTPRGRSESSNSPSTAFGSDPGSSQKHHQVPNSEPTTPLSEKQEFPAGFGLPFLARVSRSRLNVSEASVPAPSSSDISASGEVFIPAHDHPSEWEAKIYQTARTIEETTANKEVELTETPHEPSAPQSKIVEKDSDQETREGNPERSGLASSQHDQIPTSQPVPNAFGEILEPIPVIRIQRPSTPTMATSLGTSVVSSGAGATGTLPAPTGHPIDPRSTINALPVGSLASALPLPLPGPGPGLLVGGKKGKVKKLIGKARKHVIRKRLLAIVVGREVANIVHPLLSQVGNTAGAVPLPVDGASDLMTTNTRCNDWKPSTRLKQPEQRIADAKLRADAEEAKRCSTCRGVTRSKHVRRYHRLLLKRDRPGMRAVDRYATAMARAVAFKCTCSKYCP